jgi:hypothetical protein
MQSHFAMTFPSFHFTTLTYPSHPHHNLLPYTSLHFTSLPFLMISPTPSFSFINFTLFMMMMMMMMMMVMVKSKQVTVHYVRTHHNGLTTS